jgi:hypothetical protein
MYEGGRDILYGNKNITTFFGDAATEIISKVIQIKN